MANVNLDMISLDGGKSILITKDGSDQALSKLGIKIEDLDNGPGKIIEFENKPLIKSGD